MRLGTLNPAIEARQWARSSSASVATVEHRASTTTTAWTASTQPFVGNTEDGALEHPRDAG